MAIDPGYQCASTASRLDSFILPGSLQFAEYNAESPAGLGYTETLVGVFDTLAVTKRFRERYEATAPKLMGPLLDALLASYREWGGTASPPTIAIVDFRGVPTWAEFEMLQTRFIALGVPTVVCDPRDLAFDGAALTLGRTAHRPGLSSLPDQRHRRSARRLPRAGERLRRTARCASPTPCAASCRTRRRSLRCSPMRATPTCSTRPTSRPSHRTCPGRDWCAKARPSGTARPST